MNTIVITGGQASKPLPFNLTFDQDTLYIPANSHLEEPFKVTVKRQSNTLLSIVVGAHSTVKIILEIADSSLDQSMYRVHLTALENSHVKYLFISEINSEEGTLDHRFTVEKHASINLVGGFISNILTAKMHVDLVGEGADVKMRTVAVSSDEHNQTIDVMIVHKAPHTYGDMTNIGIANKKGRITLNGVEQIEKGMKQANAFQNLKGIITSDDAMIAVNPILLIDEFDVKAGHGATIGKIEEEVLFYLRSRGLTKGEAERLVINGFLRPVVDEIEDETLKARFVNVVNARI